VKLARQNSGREVVLFAVGFETTSCTVAAALMADPPPNFSILAAHRLIPPALETLMSMEDTALDGFLLPGHVLTVAGTEDYETFAARHAKATAVAGFEPVDIMLGLKNVAEWAAEGRSGLFNAYPRAVKREGNRQARRAIADVFFPAPAIWRGLGTIPDSGLSLREKYKSMDALRKFELTILPEAGDDPPDCRCAEIMLGKIEPEECPLFAESCSPDQPIGPCMVSTEGTCRSRYLYRDD
jgi:hydrogenase expression/formation protein HypD